MADVVDIATDEQLMLQERRIAEIRRTAEMPRDTGHCRNCFEPLDVGAFCDADCQLDFDKRVRMKGYV
jgi:hypothetical protein